MIINENLLDIVSEPAKESPRLRKNVYFHQALDEKCRRIQNPDDQSYIRILVSSANSATLSQPPTVPQQHVIVMGDCVRTPIVTRINDAKPRPNSNNPEFISNRMRRDYADYDGETKKWTE